MIERQDENTRLKSVIPIMSSTNSNSRSVSPSDPLRIQDLERSTYPFFSSSLFLFPSITFSSSSLSFSPFISVDFFLFLSPFFLMIFRHVVEELAVLAQELKMAKADLRFLRTESN